MALTNAARVKETTTTTGTGTINLAGAVTGFQTFVAGIGNANTCGYALLDANGTGWECGIGTITDGAPDTLARTTVLFSTNANAAITLSAGTHTVFACELPGYASKDTNFQDLLLQRPVLKDYAEKVSAPTISAGVLVLNMENGNVFNVYLSEAITDIQFQNTAIADTWFRLTLHLTQHVSAIKNVTFSSSTHTLVFLNGQLPTIAGADAVDDTHIIEFRGAGGAFGVVYGVYIGKMTA